MRTTAILIYGEVEIQEFYMIGVEDTDLELEASREDVVNWLDEDQLAQLHSGHDVYVNVPNSYFGDTTEDEEDSWDEGGEDRYIDQYYEDRYIEYAEEGVCYY